MEIFIGYDEREAIASKVCERSIRRFYKDAQIRHLRLDDPDVSEVYTRTWTSEHGQKIDTLDGKPFSTDFAFSRFLVPYLSNYTGWAMFCDGDFLFRADPRDLWEFVDDDYALMVVQHHHVPHETCKMDGRLQSAYWRKNWSSLILWNCSHPENQRLNPDMVNSMPGSFLHQFGWLHAGKIGSLPESWNWLSGVSPTTYQETQEVKAVHFTLGIPSMKGYETSDYAKEWFALA